MFNEQENTSINKLLSSNNISSCNSKNINPSPTPNPANPNLSPNDISKCDKENSPLGDSISNCNSENISGSLMGIHQPQSGGSISNLANILRDNSYDLNGELDKLNTIYKIYKNDNNNLNDLMKGGKSNKDVIIANQLLNNYFDKKYWKQQGKKYDMNFLDNNNNLILNKVKQAIKKIKQQINVIEDLNKIADVCDSNFEKIEEEDTNKLMLLSKYRGELQELENLKLELLSRKKKPSECMKILNSSNIIDDVNNKKIAQKGGQEVKNESQVGDTNLADKQKDITIKLEEFINKLGKNHNETLQNQEDKLVNNLINKLKKTDNLPNCVEIVTRILEEYNKIQSELETYMNRVRECNNTTLKSAVKLNLPIELKSVGGANSDEKIETTNEREIFTLIELIQKERETVKKLLENGFQNDTDITTFINLYQDIEGNIKLINSILGSSNDIKYNDQIKVFIESFKSKFEEKQEKLKIKQLNILIIKLML